MGRATEGRPSGLVADVGLQSRSSSRSTGASVCRVLLDRNLLSVSIFSLSLIYGGPCQPCVALEDELVLYVCMQDAPLSYNGMD